MNFSIVWFFVLSISYFIILFWYLHFCYKKDIINNVFGFGALSFTYFNVLLVMLLLNQDPIFFYEIIMLFYYTLGLPILILAIIIGFSTICVFYSRKCMKKRNFNEFWTRVEENSKKKSKLFRDSLRKIPHILIFFGLFVVWFIGINIVYDFSGSTSGMIPETQDPISLYIQLLIDPNGIKEVLFSLGWFYFLLFFFFYVLNLIMLSNEFTRKSSKFAFPFNFVCRIFFCEDEKLNYGAYLYFTIGQMFAAFITPPMVYFAILGTSSISDLLTSQIGIRFGKKKIKWNQEKSWQGAIAGVLSCFIITSLFMGIIWGLVFSFIFLIFDVITNKPLKLSDNLLIPIGLSLIYDVMQFLFPLNVYTFFLI